MATIQKTPTKGSNITPSSRAKFFNSPQRAKKIKDSIEQLKTYALIAKGRIANREEKNSVISLGLPMAREDKK